MRLSYSNSPTGVEIGRRIAVGRSRNRRGNRRVLRSGAPKWKSCRSAGTRLRRSMACSRWWSLSVFSMLQNRVPPGRLMEHVGGRGGVSHSAACVSAAGLGAGALHTLACEMESRLPGARQAVAAA